MSRRPNNLVRLSRQRQVLPILDESKGFMGRNADSAASDFRLLLSIPEAGRRQAVLCEEVRYSTKALAHGIGPDNLNASFINGMHIDRNPGWRMQFAGKPHVIGMMMGEHNRPQSSEGQASLFQASGEGSTSIGRTNTGIDQGPSIISDQSVHIDMA